MIVQFDKSIAEAKKQNIKDRLAKLGYKATEVQTQKGSYLVGIGKKDFDVRTIGHIDGVQDIHIVSDEFKLVSRKWKVKPTSVDLGDDIFIESGGMAIMTGPCSIEGEEQIMQTIAHLKENNIKLMRGGVFKTP